MGTLVKRHTTSCEFMISLGSIVISLMSLVKLAVFFTQKSVLPTSDLRRSDRDLDWL